MPRNDTEATAQLKPATFRLMQHADQEVRERSPTIAAAAGDRDVRRRRLSRARAEGVQTVEGVLAAVPWRGERVAALGVPAVDVAAVPDAAFGALCLLCLLDGHKEEVGVVGAAHVGGKLHEFMQRNVPQKTICRAIIPIRKSLRFIPDSSVSTTVIINIKSENLFSLEFTVSC